MQYTANTTRNVRDPYAVQQRLDKLSEWSRKPMTGRAECAVAAVAGSVMFVVFFAIYMIA